jgi:hypothetical protein
LGEYGDVGEQQDTRTRPESLTANECEKAFQLS